MRRWNIGLHFASDIVKLLVFPLVYFNPIHLPPGIPTFTVVGWLHFIGSGAACVFPLLVSWQKYSSVWTLKQINMITTLIALSALYAADTSR